MIWNIETAAWDTAQDPRRTFRTDHFDVDDAVLPPGETVLSAARRTNDAPFPYIRGTLEEVVDPVTGAFAIYYEVNLPLDIRAAYVVRGRPQGAAGFPLTRAEFRQLYTADEKRRIGWLATTRPAVAG